jgi:hypothetical protein
MHLATTLAVPVRSRSPDPPKPLHRPTVPRHEIAVMSRALPVWIEVRRLRRREETTVVAVLRRLFERHRDRSEEWGVDGEEVTVVRHQVAGG